MSIVRLNLMEEDEDNDGNEPDKTQVDIINKHKRIKLIFFVRINRTIRQTITVGVDLKIFITFL